MKIDIIQIELANEKYYFIYEEINRTTAGGLILKSPFNTLFDLDNKKRYNSLRESMC